MQKEKLKTQKGITLIALIITIIVMLILVGVTVTVALQGGLFNTAKDAAQKTADAAKQETEMLQYEYEIAKAKGETNAETLDEYLYEVAKAKGETSAETLDEYLYEVAKAKGETSANSLGEYILEKKYNGLKIGDKVNYNEGTGHTTTPDTSKGACSTTTRDSSTGKYIMTTKTYTNENLEWRVLGVNANEQVELISTQPMSNDNLLCLVGEDGYLYAEDNLNTFCDELYGNGYGAEKARSLNAEDINELGNYDPTTYSNYGSKWQYRYSDEAGYMQYRKSTDEGTTWEPDWTNITSSSYQTFKEPGKTQIDSTNTKDVADLKYTYYTYTVSNQIESATPDNISMAKLITEGLNDDNNASSGSNITQWLASTSVSCGREMVYFRIRCIYNGGVKFANMWMSYGYVSRPEYAVRPVVTLKPDVTLSDDDSDGVWEID